ncbi:MAG TPA: hypothetical protein VNU19_19660 [Candidatus Acidoferrum sp.]|nr:hypothetical protein [Candidatus Acidoferrum sp.]
MASYSFPLDAYSQTPDQTNNYRHAVAILEQDCMKRFGLALPRVPITSAETAIHSGLYGVTDMSTAKTDGYHSPYELHPAGQPPPDPTPAELAVLTGSGPANYQGAPVPKGGCLGEATSRIDDGAPKLAAPGLNQNLEQDAHQRSTGDSRVRAALTAWSDCMHTNGYNYADPLAAVDDSAFSGPTPSAAEITTAVADVGCKNRTNLLEIWASVETAYQNRAIEENAQELADIKKAVDVEARNAAKIISGK